MAQPPPDWHRINELLRLRQYEQAAAFLFRAQVADQQRGKAARQILTAAHQICLACIHCQAEVSWHQKAQAEAVQREVGLMQQLQTMLDFVSSDGPPEHDGPQPEKRFSLRQWARELVGRKPGSQSIEQEIATGPVEMPAAFPAQETEQIPADFLGNAEILTPLSTDELEIPTTLFAEEIESEAVLRTPPETEQADFSAIQEDTSLTAEAVHSPLPVVGEVDTSPAFPLPLDTTKTESLAGEIKISTAEAASGISDDHPNQHDSPTFVIYCLGPFRVYQDDQPIQDWKSSKGKSIFKYLAVHRKAPIAKEALMDLFWPDSTPDAARNNLNVAIYGLRQTLRRSRPDLAHILYQDEYYLLNPEHRIWVDVEAFAEHLRMAQNLEQRGELALAIREYRAAETLYQGEFLADDRYEDWPVSQRQRLATDYFRLLDRLSSYYLDQKDYDTCATMCEKMLVVDPCHEQAHFRLMQCYNQRNQRYLALRQYHLCTEALANELNVGPSQTTIEFYEQIRQARQSS